MPGYNLEGELKLYEQDGGHANHAIIIEDNGKEIALDDFLYEATAWNFNEGSMWEHRFLGKPLKTKRWAIRMAIWLDPIEKGD